MGGEVRSKVVVDGEPPGTGGVAGGGLNRRRGAAAAPTSFRRAAAATPLIRRHGAARVNGTLVSTALYSSEERFFFAIPSLLVFFLVDGPPSGSWRGSYMREDDIARLVRLRRIPAGVVTRAATRSSPGRNPANPHHLPANACVLLSCYVAFMEGYAGLWPDVEFWSRLFYIKAQTTDGHLRTCGAASIYPRTGVVVSS
ncbi:hypothetical protein QYE76_033593 [Lolium multiflorum]|uniref:Uncharacterized protein n=1 Tax=Lolium multiflorum TaxID=4521 RepID=A0AAD8VM82_LOLMU|nr:hypothetical protein QYE76_033593 [Lolium multiflorum]